MNLEIQPLFNFFIGRIPMMRHHISFSSRSSPGNRTIFWLRGSWPRFRVSCTNQQNPTLLALSATTRVPQATVSLEAIWGDARTKFLHPETSVMSSKALDLPLRKPITLRACYFNSIKTGFRPSKRSTINPCRHLTVDLPTYAHQKVILNWCSHRFA